MKKTKLILGMFLIVFSVIGNAQQLTSKTYDNYGRIHNQALDNFIRVFKEVNVENFDQAVEHINSIHANFYSTLSLSNDEKTKLISSSTKFKFFVAENGFFNYLYSDSNSFLELSSGAKQSIASLNNQYGINSESPSLKQVVDLAFSRGLMDAYEKNKLTEINQLVYQNKTGEITIDELIQKINSIATEFDAKNYDFKGKNGHALALTLSLSTHSLSWWKTNSDVFISSENIGRKGGPNVEYDNSTLLAPWVAADVVGAVYGGTVGAIGSYATTGSVNWGAAGISAVGGAIAGSTGIIGKAGKWLSSFF